MNRLNHGIRRVFKEPIELGRVRKLTYIETTHMGKSRMSVEKIEKPGNSFNLFKVFNDKSFKKSMLGITQAAALLFFVRKAGKIKVFEQQVIFSMKSR